MSVDEPDIEAARQVWLGLGGNIGDVRNALAAALDRLQGHPCIVVKHVSSLYKTAPWGVTDQPSFLNCCAELATSLSPQELLAACQAVEHEGGRKRLKRWGPRTIDVDMLVYDNVECDEPDLILPHPRMHERAFVMVPMAQIAADLMVAGKTVQDHTSGLDVSGVERVEDEWWSPAPPP